MKGTPRLPCKAPVVTAPHTLVPLPVPLPVPFVAVGSTLDGLAGGLLKKITNYHIFFNELPARLAIVRPTRVWDAVTIGVWHGKRGVPFLIPGSGVIVNK